MKRRQEFLDTEYVKGVVNKDGELAIRRLSEAEKEWLNQFYKETLNTKFDEFDSFYPTPGIEHISAKTRKKIRKPFLNKDKSINNKALATKSIVKRIARKYKIPEESVVNLVKRKELYDANNALNSDWFKAGMRATCEYPFDNTEEDYFSPESVDEYSNHFEDAMNEYLDFQHRRDMKWDDLED